MFPSLPIEPAAGGRGAARVCIATYEILGPSKNGGIGTAYHSLATTLAAANHDVTILYLWAARSDPGEMRYWENHFRTVGITFFPLPGSSGFATVPHCMQTACDAHAWLRKQHFDVIHFPELHGHAYYCVLAKHQGLDFHNTILCVGTHSPISWIREQNKEAPYSPDELEMDFMERQSVALADVVVSPSQYMLAWMQRRSWSLPAACYVQQNIAPPELTAVASLPRKLRGTRTAGDLVFFGRLEARKGIGLFCDAVDLLKNGSLRQFSVTFLGKNGRVAGRDGVSFIRRRAENWRFPHRILTDFDRDAALQFLSEDPGRLAIIPSFEDNLPSTVTECLAGNIPFLAGRGGGIPELIASSDIERTTFPPDAVQLAERLALAIRDGVPVARPAIDPHENRQRWINWHAALASRGHGDGLPEQRIRIRPPEQLVTVCLNHRGPLELLRHCLQSLRCQTYSKCELLLSNYTAPTAEDELRHVIEDFESKGWLVARRAGRDCSADASGEYVIFIEDSDYLTPHAIETFVQVAISTRADVLTCFLNLFTGIEPPAQERCLGKYPFLGAAIISGIFRNHFGGRVVFVKKDALPRLGMFPTTSRRDCADWEFLARAALMHCRMEVIPAPLAWYRISDESGALAPMEYLDQLQAIAPYTAEMPIALRNLPGAALTAGLHYQNLLKRFSQSPAHTILQRLPISRNNGDGDWAIPNEAGLVFVLNQMPRKARRKLASMLDGWLEYSTARSQLPPYGFQRISRIARQLVRGHYHRYAHGFGSALRDLRKPSQFRE